MNNMQYLITLTEYPSESVHQIVIQTNSEVIAKATAESLLASMPRKEVFNYSLDREQETSWSASWSPYNA